MICVRFYVYMEKSNFKYRTEETWLGGDMCQMNPRIQIPTDIYE